MSSLTEREIFFRCPACRRRLAAESRARGLIVACPACRASVLVPDRSTALNPSVVRRLGTAAIILFGMLGVGAAGWALARDAARPDREVPAVAVRARAAPDGYAEPRASEPSDRAQLERELNAARGAQQAASRRYEELANWVLANMRGRFLLKERHAARLRFTPVTGDFTVNPELADFLSVDDRESGLLNDILQYGRTTLLALQQQVLTATQPAPDQVLIYIPPFAREGAGLRDDLYAGMRSVLGPDRFERLLQVSEEDFSRAYDYFGAAARTLAIQLVPGEHPRDPPHLAIRDAWVIQKDESRRVTEMTEEAVRELPSRYVPYLAWMPDFVSFYVKP